MLTEKQAKEKTCPKSIGIYNPVQGPGPHSCLGSACMAWRWQQKNREVQSMPYKPDFDPPYGPWREVAGIYGWVSEETPTTGYCGLAGKP